MRESDHFFDRLLSNRSRWDFAANTEACCDPCQIAFQVCQNVVSQLIRGRKLFELFLLQPCKTTYFALYRNQLQSADADFHWHACPPFAFLLSRPSFARRLRSVPGRR